MSERNPDSGQREPRKRRERWDLGDGAYMDISIDPDCSPETRAALIALGQAAKERMAEEKPLTQEVSFETGAPRRARG